MNYQRQPEKLLDDLWPGYLQGGYFDGRDKKDHPKLKLEYVSREKVEPLVAEMSNARPPLNMHQLRRFFQHCRMIEAKLRQGVSTWEAEKANFALLDSAAADAYGKRQDDFRSEPKKIPRLFHDFIKRNVKAVETEEDFIKGFLLHFEALVGFGALHLRERDRN